MQIPAAGFIEIANDQLRTVPREQMEKQGAELYSAIGDAASPSVVYGYQLGLQTARVILETSSMLAIKGVKAEDVL